MTTPITSGIISGWLRSGLLSKLTGITSLGARRVALLWDTATKMIVLTEVDAANTVVRTIFSVPTTEIQRATFFQDTVMLRVAGVRYDFSLRDGRAKNTLARDAVQIADAAIGSPLAVRAQLKSQLGALEAFLLAENPDRTYGQKGATRLYVYAVTIAIAVLIVLFIVTSIV